MCVSGRTCALDGILGKDLRFGDAFLVLDTCSEVSHVPRFIGEGVVEVVQSTGASVAWNSLSFVSAARGQYRLCWCSNWAYSCSVDDSF